MDKSKRFFIRLIKATPSCFGMIKAIVFDYGGVLTLHGTFDEWYPLCAQRYGSNPGELKAIFTEQWRKARVGEIDSRLLWQKLAGVVQQPPAHLRKEWIDWFGIRKEMYPLLSKLKEKYTLALLSNQIKDWMEEARTQQQLDDYFQLILFSYEVKVAKPDSRIFALLLEKLDVRPVECLYIDDREKNTSVAATLGFHTLLFSTKEQLQQDLTAMGVLKLPGRA